MEISLVGCADIGQSVCGVDRICRYRIGAWSFED